MLPLFFWTFSKYPTTALLNLQCMHATIKRKTCDFSGLFWFLFVHHRCLGNRGAGCKFSALAVTTTSSMVRLYISDVCAVGVSWWSDHLPVQNMLTYMKNLFGFQVKKPTVWTSWCWCQNLPGDTSKLMTLPHDPPFEPHVWRNLGSAVVFSSPQSRPMTIMYMTVSLILDKQLQSLEHVKEKEGVTTWWFGVWQRSVRVSVSLRRADLSLGCMAYLSYCLDCTWVKRQRFWANEEARQEGVGFIRTCTPWLHMVLNTAIFLYFCILMNCSMQWISVLLLSHRSLNAANFCACAISESAQCSESLCLCYLSIGHVVPITYTVWIHLARRRHHWHSAVHGTTVFILSQDSRVLLVYQLCWVATVLCMTGEDWLKWWVSFVFDPNNLIPDIVP